MLLTTFSPRLPEDYTITVAVGGNTTGFSELQFQQVLMRISACCPMKAIHHKGLIRMHDRGIVATR
jgi:hypothetical protein